MTKLTNVSKARARLLLNSAFFGTIMVTSPMVERHDIPTAATDMRHIFYNPAFFDELPVDEIIGVLAHEVMHIALEHGLRRQGREPRMWNYACDYAINPILIDCGFKLPAGCLFERRFLGMSAEAIYDILEKEQQARKKRGQGQPGSDMGDVPGIGSDLIEPAPASPEEAAKLREEVRNKVVQAATMGRLAGNMPASLQRAIDEVIHPPVPWEDILRPMMRSVVKHDESWSRRNRRFSSVYLPSQHSERIVRVVVIGDTSGSITGDDLKRIGGSIIDIAEEVRPEQIHVLWADTRVASEQVFDCGDRIELAPQGGGGTDMRVPLARADELEPDAVVLITDGYTPWPDDEPSYPLIVVCTTKAAVPVGEVVRI
jgi:predicted metal-dependent peptidase